MLAYTLQSTVLLECVKLFKELIYNDQIVFQFHRCKQGSSGISHKWHNAVLICPSYFIYKHKYQQTYQIMWYFDTSKLSESGNRNGSVTPVWVEALLVQVVFCRANVMTVADARRFVASREAKRSGIAASLWHIWLPAAPLRQLASSYERACKSSPPVPRCILVLCMHGETRIEYSAVSHIFHDFSVRGSTSTKINCLYAGTFYRYRHRWIYWFPGSRYALPTQIAYILKCRNVSYLWRSLEV
jgi:hypothetical protein